jgi:D-aspartate ligase
MVGDSGHKRRSVLLMSGSSGGTIAAARRLCTSGIDVRIVTAQRLCAAAWSNSVSHTYSGPSEHDSGLLLARLLEIGAEAPGQILLPTSDETAWLYAVNAAQLSKHFTVYQPGIAALMQILDKKLLTEAAANAGLDVLPIWDPRNLEELSDLLDDLPYPMLIKPRSHIHRRTTNKGIFVSAKPEMISCYKKFLELEQSRVDPDPLLYGTGRPILQPFIAPGPEGVHSITGFIDKTGNFFVTRHSAKIFQRSPPLGIGICFESLPAAPSLSKAIHRLCRDLGYFGIFEVEFVCSGGKWMVIDFNPRMFHQIGMDIARGVPLPLLACLDAIGETAALRDAIAAADSHSEDQKVVVCDRFLFRTFLVAHALTSRMSAQERACWRAWIKRHKACAIDIVGQRSDMMPAIVHALTEISVGLKGIPRFLRSKPYSILPGQSGQSQ